MRISIHCFTAVSQSLENSRYVVGRQYVFSEQINSGERDLRYIWYMTEKDWNEGGTLVRGGGADLDEEADGKSS